MAKIKLFEQWGAMDDRRLSKQPVSLRLPLHILARIEALQEMYPSRKRSEIINDLLKVALEAYEDSLPPPVYDCPPEEFLANLSIIPEGPATDYRISANKHYRRLEKELGTKNPYDPFKLR